MFSGIVEAMATIRTVEERESTRRFVIDAPFASELGVGDSVSIDGACMTATTVDDRTFSVDVIGTTLAKTVAGRYEPGAKVNVERALALGSRIDGHLVQGHVDGVGHLTQHTKEGDFWLLDFRIPSAIANDTIEHGSITLNGVSLTVSELLPDSGVRIGIIPHTHAHTNLGTLEVGDPVNVEGDMIGKYVARILARRGQRGD
ncbi:MAG: riboflavin synthase [Gemmatimonadota bacterium]